MFRYGQVFAQAVKTRVIPESNQGIQVLIWLSALSKLVRRKFVLDIGAYRASR